MKKSGIVIFLFLFVYLKTYSQDLINPYLEYQGQLSTDLKIASINYYIEEMATIPYNGEYEILLDNSNPWGNQLCGGWDVAPFDYINFGLSYQMELVSFPFSIDCAFPSSTDTNGGCNQPIDRILNVPDDSLLSPSTTRWDYPYKSSSLENSLWRVTDLKKFDRDQLFTKAFSDQSINNTLVSASFVHTVGTSKQHTVLPHSVLKHTVNIHCGNDIELHPIISSFSWYSDLTRGRMREYPFHFGSILTANLQSWDIITRPEFFNFGVYSQTDDSYCTLSRTAIGYSCNGEINTEGFPINNTPFDPVLDDYCPQYIPSAGNFHNAEYGSLSCYHNSLFCIPLQDYTIIASTAPKNYNGTTLAGYELNVNTLQLIDPSPPLYHKYTIDKNINLNLINPSEKIIFNPSEVYITAFNLKFPTNYTFKTIRGVFPFASEVDSASNDPANGGPFTDPTKRDIPVETDLFKDFHVGSQYPSNDHKYSSIYHLQSGSKLTIEPCVKIFDATFEINPGSEIVFQDWSTNQININRYQLLYGGGIVTKQKDIFLFQKDLETREILKYKAGNYILAGANVDTGKTIGEYSVEPNAQVAFSANNFIDLESGFYAKAGSKFEASVKPVSIPPCGPMRIRNPKHYSTSISNSPSEIGYFTISPNPTTDNSYFMFEIFEMSNAQIFIFDSMGKIIQQVGQNSLLTKGKYSFKFQSENLSPGIYLAKLFTTSSQKSIKFIKL